MINIQFEKKCIVNKNEDIATLMNLNGTVWKKVKTDEYLPLKKYNVLIIKGTASQKLRRVLLYITIYKCPLNKIYIL